jgi:hypothetical protein
MHRWVRHCRLFWGTGIYPLFFQKVSGYEEFTGVIGSKASVRYIVHKNLSGGLNVFNW